MPQAGLLCVVCAMRVDAPHCKKEGGTQSHWARAQGAAQCVKPYASQTLSSMAICMMCLELLLLVTLLDLHHPNVDFPLDFKFSAQVRNFRFQTLQSLFDPKLNLSQSFPDHFDH